MEHLTIQGRVANSFVAVIIGVVIALALQIVGFATPGWIVVKVGTVKIDYGLWYSKICTNGKCQTEDHNNPLLSAVGAGMREYQIETCIALGLLVIAIGMYCCLRCGPCSGNMKMIVFCTVFSILLSGILAVAAAGKHGNNVRIAHDLYKSLLGVSPYMVPYSVILTGLGGILAGVMALVILFTVKPWQSDASPPPSYDMPAQPGVVYPSQPNPGYQHPGSAPYAGQPQSGHIYQGPPADPAYGRKY